MPVVDDLLAAYAPFATEYLVGTEQYEFVLWKEDALWKGELLDDDVEFGGDGVLRKQLLQAVDFALFGAACDDSVFGFKPPSD